ncbi:hypothetical protein CTAYLR_006444 [Chrysophaeum taylorii]|uniref:Glycosyltransferase 2-like domain-containing protein n=1 Tax=Chrysophaeum taylorii TaxID=2483200 RepID=A0AAD7ULG0_9STRA|nr:hypothetical protein CTAYLR_006444 [Chrysophaeum taylorii]
MDAKCLANICAFVGDVPARTSSHTRRAVREPRNIVDVPRPGVRVVIFSKDRPYQLGCLLRSIEQHVVGADLDIIVIWRADDAALYDPVRATFPNVWFEREQHAGDFERLLRSSCGGRDFILACVDDAFLYRPVDLGAAVRVLIGDAAVLAFHLKLSPHVTWSHPASKPCEPPLLELASTDAARLEAFPALVWKRSAGEYDWGYAWDLCCSLYRSEDFERVLEVLPSEALAHPNLLETRGAEIIASVLDRPKCACFARPAVAVLAINRVQDIFRAPIYDDAPSLEALNMESAPLDYAAYRRLRFDSVHLGAVFLRFANDSPRATVTPTPLVTVIIPARNAARTVMRAVESVLRQSVANDARVLVVDDGSSDDTAAIVGAMSDPRVRLVENSRRGVAAALNTGLALIQSKFVARLDADDECFGRDRLATQLEFLQANLTVAVLGGAAVTFWNDDDGSSKRVDRYCVHPCHPLRVAWSLNFSCQVTHPTVMARTSALRCVGGYSEAAAIRHAEDYDLWLRLTDHDAATVANVSDPLVWLRKSQTSVSSTHRQEQDDAALTSARAAYCRRLRHPVDARSAAAMRRPTDHYDVEILADAANLLLALETAFFLDMPGSTDESARRATVAIGRDVDARLAEIALLGARKAPGTSAAKRILDLWARRSPKSTANLLATLFHSDSTTASNNDTE